MSSRKGIQTRYFPCTPFLISFIEFCMVKINTSSCHIYPIRLMVCRDARLPFSIKKGNLLGIFEKWPNSKPSSRSTGNLKFSWPQSDLRDEKSSQPLKLSLVASSLSKCWNSEKASKVTLNKTVFIYELLELFILNVPIIIKWKFYVDICLLGKMLSSFTVLNLENYFVLSYFIWLTILIPGSAVQSIILWETNLVGHTTLWILDIINTMAKITQKSCEKY